MVTANYTPDRLDRWGFDRATLQSLRPGLIVANLAVMGLSGPDAGWRSYGNGLVAMSGIAAHTGFDGRVPQCLGTMHTDFTVPYFPALQILAALHHRDRTGGALPRDVQYESSVRLLDVELADVLNGGRPGPPRQPVGVVRPTRDVPRRRRRPVGRHRLSRRRRTIGAGRGDRRCAEPRRGDGVDPTGREDIVTALRAAGVPVGAGRGPRRPSHVTDDAGGVGDVRPAVRRQRAVVQEPITWDGERLPLRRAPLWMEHTYDVFVDELGLDVAELRLQQREGLGDLLVLSNAIEATEAELQPFVNRYVLDGPERTGPMPLECAFEKVEASLARERDLDAASSTRETARANALLLLGAAIDGHPATPALADIALLPVEAVRAKGRCGAVRLPDALAQASVLMADARQAPTTASKNDAMRALLRSAGWQWAGWMLAGFGLIQLARRSIPPALGIALALAHVGDRGVDRPRSVAARRRTRVRARAGRCVVVHDAGAFRAVAARVRRRRPRLVGMAVEAASGRTRDDGVAARLSGSRGRHRHRLAAAPRSVGQRAHRQSLSGALSPGSSLARDADLERRSCSCASPWDGCSDGACPCSTE